MPVKSQGLLVAWKLNGVIGRRPPHETALGRDKPVLHTYATQPMVHPLSSQCSYIVSRFRDDVESCPFVYNQGGILY